jgi:hypothetical protein
MEGSGLSKSMDVLWRDLDLDQVPKALRERLSKLIERIGTGYGVTVRSLREDDMEVELEQVYRFVSRPNSSHAPPAGSLLAVVELVGDLNLVAGDRDEGL